MRNGKIFVYYGEGRGKTTLAIGQGIRAVGEERKVIMVQFLDYNRTKEGIPLKKLEPEFKIFRFEKHRETLDSSEDEKRGLMTEIALAFNFSKKIIETGECDMLIMDGIAEAIYNGYVDEQEFCSLLDKKQSYMDIIITGNSVSDNITAKADCVYKICTEKKDD